MADFISNSAILTTVRPSSVLTAAAATGPWREKTADFTWKSAIATIADEGGQDNIDNLQLLGAHYDRRI